MRLAGKLAVVTAAASGMGRAGVRRFVEEGARVAAVDIDQAGLQSLVAELGEANVVAVPADLSTPEGAGGAIDASVAALEGIDLLWAHAGTPGAFGFEPVDVEAYRRTIDLNMTSAVFAANRAVVPMRARGGGAILFTASMVGLVGSGTSPIYSAAKFGIVGLGKSLALNLAADNIRVNVLCPGLTETPMKLGFTAPTGSLDESEANTQRIVAATPLARVGLPEDMANAALWLLSDEASFVTGITLPIDGGYTCR